MHQRYGVSIFRASGVTRVRWHNLADIWSKMKRVTRAEVVMIWEDVK